MGGDRNEAIVLLCVDIRMLGDVAVAGKRGELDSPVSSYRYLLDPARKGGARFETLSIGPDGYFRYVSDHGRCVR